MIGAPYDIYLICDYETVKTRYKAHIFIQPAPTEELTSAIADAAESALVLTPKEIDISAEALRTFCEACGVPIVCPDTVVYRCGDYLFIHTCNDGEHVLNIPDGTVLRDLFTDTEWMGTQTMHIGESHLYSVTKKSE